ncbi:MAG: type II toxin-antitoxin system RelE/ParE family toxin [Chloroflexi bacterium]|jgi:mRNA interferase RelE/StbE|nr:type II toxin-antitoxin system RelE/ParE family toxin [Chloroflexota bacterium]BCY19538.1 hypothetical protein hrd7_33870 [Leptolinea sp. HRD-7]
MSWEIVYTHEAREDLKKLDHSQRVPVLKAIEKVSGNPLPQSEGGFGKPLGNHASSRLAGYLKITLMALGLRVVYTLRREEKSMVIIVISIRSDETVYKIAHDRTR